MKISGIYRIKNTLNGKVYIGSSKHLSHRKTSHFNHLRKGKSHCTHLQRAYDKYGEAVFEFSVLEVCAEDVLAEREQWHIDYYDAANGAYGYNVIPNVVRIVFTDEMRRKMSIARKGKPQSEEHKRNRGRAMSIALKGRKMSEEQKQKRRDSAIRNKVNVGAVRSPETRRKMSESMKGRGLGVKFTDERRQKMSLAAPKKIVEQVGLDGSLLRIFPSIKDAALNTGIHRTCISGCLSGAHKTAGGFQWRLAA